MAGRIPRGRWMEAPIGALTSWTGIACIVAGLALGVGSYTRFLLRDLPDPGHGAAQPESIVVHDRLGGMLGEQDPGGEVRIAAPLSSMGRYGPAATLAAEDRDFYQHGSIDVGAVLRAAAVDLVHRQALQGGSSITQQLVKLELLDTERSLTRKAHEGFLAWAMERRYTKDEILEQYLNRVYYGHQAYGLVAAATTYFGPGKDPSTLTPAQAAFLAGLINAPALNDPATNFPGARARQLYVLAGMVTTGALTAAEAKAADAEDIQSELQLRSASAPRVAPHFFQFVMRQLEQLLGPEVVQEGGFTVETTLDPNLQSLAEKSVSEGVAHLSSLDVNNGDLLAAQPSSGEILAWVGSADYNNAGIGGQYDVVVSPRQPGSSFKPYVYEAALRDHRITLCTTVHDVPTSFAGGYAPHDFDDRFMGEMTARQALILSRNIPAVAVGSYEGIPKVDALAHAMGIRSELQPYPSTAIGTSEVTMLDHIQGYSVFANQGRLVPLTGIRRVVGRGGEVLYDRALSPDRSTQVLTPAEAFLITDTLKEYQRQWQLGWSFQMASKSGTTNRGSAGHPDAWMMAYTPDIVVGSWAGNTGASGKGGLTSAFGSDVGKKLLAAFVNGLPAAFRTWYGTPSGIVRGADGTPFLQGTKPARDCGASSVLPTPRLVPIVPGLPGIELPGLPGLRGIPGVPLFPGNGPQGEG